MTPYPGDIFVGVSGYTHTDAITECFVKVQEHERLAPGFLAGNYCTIRFFGPKQLTRSGACGEPADGFDKLPSLRLDNPRVIVIGTDRMAKSCVVNSILFANPLLKVDVAQK